MTIKNTLWLAPFIFFVIGFLITRSFFHVQQFPVPSIVGAPLNQAFTILSNHNLSIRLTDQKIDLDLPDGTILNQNPAAGQLVKPRQTVFVTISSRPQPMQAPDFVGKELEAITLEAKKAGIKLRYYYLPSIYPANSCIAQSPRPGENLNQSGIIMYVAKEIDYCFIWPNFVGKPLVQVTEFLERYDIIPHITVDPSGTSPADLIVTDQRPLAGSIVSMVKNQLPIVQIYAQ